MGKRKTQMSLACQARAWEATLEKYLFDDDGVVLSALDAQTMKPDGVDRVYENSDMAMGSLLEAYCYRYAAAPDDEVARKARRLFRVMHAIVGTGGLRGWIPRPHDNDSSVDQMIYVAHAFDVFHQSRTSSGRDRGLARRALGDVAHYWRAHGYLETRPDGSVDTANGDYRRGAWDHALMAAFQLYDWHHNRAPEARRAYDEIMAAAGQRLHESFLDEAARLRRPYASCPYVPQMYSYLLDACAAYDPDRRDEASTGWASWG